MMAVRLFPRVSDNAAQRRPTPARRAALRAL
jgi:hypothetical protein